LCFRSIQSEKKTIIVVTGIVYSILIQDQGIGERADLQQPVPVCGIARQPRDLQAEDDAGLAQTDFRHQLLKSLAIGRCRGRQTEVGVDDNDSVHRPPQSDGMLAEIILADRAFCILEYLAECGLPDVQVSVAFQMVGAYLFMCGAGHMVAS
jgi:hypothetical protein